MNEYRHDAVHPTLGRARKVAQTTFADDAGGAGGARAGGARAAVDDMGSVLRGAGRDRYGASDVLEVTGAGGLSDFTFGGTTTGEAWSLNPYAGCQHACTYCYVPDTIKAERRRWGRFAAVKKDLPTRLAREIGRRERMTVYLSTATDPYQAIEAEHRITRRCLEVLARRDWPVEILTRSPLVLRDLDVLTRFSQVRVGFSIPTLDDAVRRAIEPRAPGIPARLRALRRLANEGIPTFVNMTPACPPTTHDADAIARTLLDAGAQWVNSKGLQRRSTTLVPMWERLHGTPWEDLTRFFASRERQEAWHQDLGQAFRRLGVAFSTPFFNPPFEALAPTTPSRQRRLDEPGREEPMLVARRPFARGQRAPLRGPVARHKGAALRGPVAPQP